MSSTSSCAASPTARIRRAPGTGATSATWSSPSWRPRRSRSRVWLARDRLVPALGPQRLEQVLAWLGQVHGKRVYDDNWVLFPVAVACLEPRPRTDHRRPAHRRGHRHDAPLGRGRRLVHRWRRPCLRPVHRLGGPLAPAPLGRHRWRPPARGPRPGLASAATFLRDLPALAAEDGAVPLMGRSLGYKFATAGHRGARRAPRAVLPIDAGLARGHHRPLHPLPPRPRRHRPRDRLVPGRHLGRATERARALHARGRSAWAVHAVLPLALPPGPPVLDRARPWPAGRQRAADRAGRGPRAARPRLPREPATGRRRVWVASALMDHPDDIPGHDYRPTYGKWLYHAAFPFTRMAADRATRAGRRAAPRERRIGGIGHRGLVDDGRGRPGLDLDPAMAMVGDGGRHDVTAVSIRQGRRLGAGRPGCAREARSGRSSGSLPLGGDDAGAISRHSDGEARTEAATDGASLGGHPSARRLRPGGAIRSRAGRRGRQPGRGVQRAADRRRVRAVRGRTAAGPRGRGAGRATGTRAPSSRRSSLEGTDGGHGAAAAAHG